jgi:hypothetical protein
MTGDFRLDAKLEELNKEHYMEINERITDAQDEAFAKHMGPQFKYPPLMSRDMIIEMIEVRRDRIIRYVELQVPEFFMQIEYSELNKLIQALNDGKFALTDSEVKYLKDYTEREKKFSPLQLSWQQFDYEEVFKEFWN